VALDQSSAVSGVLATGNGGTGSAFFQVSGPVTSIKTFTFPNQNATIEYQANKNAASGYAGLTAGTKLNAAQGQEVWSSADLTDFTDKSGTGTTIIGATFTSLAANDIPKWNGANWVNSASAAKADTLTNDPTDCSANQYATAIAANGNLTCSQPSTSNLSDGTNVVKNNQANTYSGGGLQDFSANKLALPAATTLPATCTANKEVYVDTDATPAGQQVYLCNAAGNGWNLIGDGGGGGGGDNISVNGVAATDADFDDSTPAAPASALNVKWQKDALTPNNLSAYLPYTAPLTATSGNLDCIDASGSAKGCLTSTDWTTFNGKAGLATAGTNGIAAYNAGDDTTAARSDHTHRTSLAAQWHFPGAVVTGVQSARALVPEGVTNCVITNSRITVNTTSSGSSTWNIQRCTGGAGNCATTANIYSSNVTLNASAESVAGGAPNTSTISAGDAFRVNLVTVGSSLADVTVAMTYTCENTN